MSSYSYKPLTAVHDLSEDTFGGHTAFGPNAPGAMHSMAGHGHEHGHGHGGHHATIQSETGESPRRCTDLGICVCWMIVMITWIAIYLNASRHGSFDSLTHGVDYYGRTCGTAAGVENKPWLFWCRSDAAKGGKGIPLSVDLDHPICVEACPSSTDSLGDYICMAPVESVASSIPGGILSTLNTSIVRIRESKVYSRPYPTGPRGGRYCVPKDTTLRSQILETPFRALGPFSPRRILVALGTIDNADWLFVLVALLTVILGYLYLYTIKFCPKFVVIIATFLPTLWCFATALGFSFFWMPWLWPGKDAGISKEIMKINPIYSEWDIQEASIITGILAILFWFAFLFFVLLIHKFDGIMVGDLIHVSLECILTVKAMIYQPIIEALAKCLVFFLSIKGLQVIASENWVEKDNILVNGARFAGLSRNYTPSLHDVRFYLMLIVWLIVTNWAMETVNCFSQFLISYEVFKYYGTKKENGKKVPPKPEPIFDGVKYGFIYHFGSILKGALTIWPTRIPRICYWAAATLFDPDNQADSNNSSCHCCINCIQSVLGLMCCGCGKCGEGVCKKSIQDPRSVNKDGFEDVVIRANDFDPACVKGHEMLEHSHPIVKRLYQELDQTTINVVGVCSIATLNAGGVYLVVNFVDMYKEPESGLYLADKEMVVALAWLLSAQVAFGFMTLWDHTCDSILYCYAWSRKWNRHTVDKYIPDTLRYIVGFDDTENDRYPYYGHARNNMYLRSWLPMVGIEEKKKHQHEKHHKLTGEVVDLSHPEQPEGSWLSGMGMWRAQEDHVSREV